MFNRIGNLLNSFFSDISSTFIWIFAIGILVCAIGVFAGGDENEQKFKRGLKISGVGLVVFILARPIVQYIQQNL